MVLWSNKNEISRSGRSNLNACDLSEWVSKAVRGGVYVMTLQMDCVSAAVYRNHIAG